MHPSFLPPPETRTRRAKSRARFGIFGIEGATGSTALLLCALLGWSALGCTGSPSGPPFSFAPAPPDHRGRIYVYRADPRSSYARIKISLADQPLGFLRNEEYTTLEVSPGTHLLRAEVHGLPYVPIGWNDYRFRIRPGETLFLEVEMRAESRDASPRSLEISGRSNDVLVENVYIRELSRSQAEPELARTRRAPIEEESRP